MSNIYDILSTGLLAVLLSFVLKELGMKGAKLVSVTGIIVIIGLSLSSFSKISDFFFDSMAFEGGERVFRSLMKIIGAGYVFGLSSEVCRELGEGGVASMLTAAGKVEIALVSLPFIKEVGETALELLR